MALHTGRQTFMALEALSHTVERKTRRVLRAAIFAALAFAMFFAMLTPLVWTPLTKPHVYAASPDGGVLRLQIAPMP